MTTRPLCCALLALSWTFLALPVAAEAKAEARHVSIGREGAVAPITDAIAGGVEAEYAFDAAGPGPVEIALETLTAGTVNPRLEDPERTPVQQTEAAPGRWRGTLEKSGEHTLVIHKDPPEPMNTRYTVALYVVAPTTGATAAEPGSAVASAATPTGSASLKLLPVDEAAADPSFATFRATLLKALADKDTAALLEAVDPQIKASFGGDEGIKAFRRMWKLDGKHARDSAIWQELGDVLRLGGAWSGEGEQKTFWAPYVFARFPDHVEATEYAAIVGDNVRARAKPSSKAEAVATFSRDLVRTAPDNGAPVKETIGGQTYLWVTIRLANGRTGYVWGKFIRTSLDYRAGFSKRDGRWRLDVFVSGD